MSKQNSSEYMSPSTLDKSLDIKKQFSQVDISVMDVDTDSLQIDKNQRRNRADSMMSEISDGSTLGESQFENIISPQSHLDI